MKKLTKLTIAELKLNAKTARTPFEKIMATTLLSWVQEDEEAAAARQAKARVSAARARPEPVFC